MAHDLHIKRLRNRVRCGSAKVARHGRRRIEAIVAKKLREELDVQLCALFSALSIRDEVEIAIRRVSLRLRLSQLDADADDIASA